MNMNLLLVALTMITINSELNSHQVNQKLDEHHAALSAHKVANDKYEANKVANEANHAAALANLKEGSAQHNHIQSIQAQLVKAHSKSGAEFDAEMAKYNQMVDLYNAQKDNYCPLLIKLQDAKPVDPKSPEFACRKIADLCSHYAGYTMLLQKIFDPENVDNFKPEEFLSKDADCLLKKIENHILPDGELPKKDDKVDNVKVEMSFKAKCCKKAASEAVNLSADAVIEIKDEDLYEKLKIELIKVENHAKSIEEAKSDIARAVSQMKASINNPPAPAQSS